MRLRLSVLAIMLALLVFSGASAQSAPALQWRSLGEPGNGGFIVAVAVSPHDPNRVLATGDMLGVAISSDGGESWGGTFGFDSWEMAEITYHPTDPNIVWVGSMSGPYRSTDGGINWTSQRRGMGDFQFFYSVPIQKILFDPRDSNTLYAFGGSKRNWDTIGTPDWGSVWRSSDGGANWTRIAHVGSRARPGIMSAAWSSSAPYALYVVADGLVWRSDDDGANWRSLPNGIPTPHTVQWIEPDPRQRDTLYASTYARQTGSGWQPGGIFRTSDGGANWTQLTTNGLGQVADGANLTSAYHIVRVTPSGVLYTSDWAWNVSGVFKLTPGATRWQQVTGYGSLRPATAMRAGAGAFYIGIDPTNEQRVFTVNTEYILRTTNGGANWTDVSSAQPDPARPHLWRGRGFNGWVATNIAINPYRDQVGILAMDDGKFWFSEDGYQTWQLGSINAWGAGNDASFTGVNGSTIYMTTGQFRNNDGIWKSTDGGRNWARTAFPAGASGEGRGVYAHPTTQQVWVVYGGRLYASSDGGGSWSTVTSNGIQNDGGLNWIAVHPTQPLTFYVGGAGGVWQTSDGAAFSIMPGSPRNVHRVVSDPTTPGRIYATRWRTYSNDGLYRYDSGTWTYLRNDYALANVAVHPQNANYLAAITDDHPFHDDSDASGVWISIDGGANWTQQNAGLPMLRGAAIRFNPHHPEQLIIGLGGRGFFITEWRAAQPTSDLRGTVSLQGRTSSGNVTLNVEYAQGNSSTTTTVTTDANGAFVVSALAPFTYRVRVKHAQYLAAALDVTLPLSAPVSFGTLRAGDVNDDNRVTLVDFSLVSGMFNRRAGDAGFDARADLNGDGVVTLVDFSLLAGNFNQTGS